MGPDAIYNFKQFQFYLSSIKRVLKDCYDVHHIKFQFYLSSIKRKCPYHPDTRERVFQFYLSSIKSYDKMAYQLWSNNVSILP